MSVEKVKIKLSELTDLYDIEDDIKDIDKEMHGTEKVVTKEEQDDYEMIIEQGDKELKEKFEDDT